MQNDLTTALKDIETEGDIAYFLDRFYGRVRQDSDLGYIFDDVAKVDWPSHLTRIAAFWSGILLDSGNYRGNPMRPHLELAQKTPISAEHFDTWLSLFEQTLNDYFAGQRTREALLRAQSIAAVMQSRLYMTGLLSQ